MNPEADMNITSKWMPGEIPPDPTPKYDPNPEIRRVEGAIFHPKRVAHGAIIAEDLESLVDYYTNFVGLHEVFRASNSSYVILSGTVPGRDLPSSRPPRARLWGCTTSPSRWQTRRSSTTRRSA